MERRQETLLTAGLVLLPLLGCTQEPGALRLEVRVADDYPTDPEPIPLHMVLIADDGPVCLARSRHYAVTARRVDDPSFDLQGTNQVFLCGTGLVAVLPAYPLLLIPALLDVADTQGRMEILHRGQRHECSLGLVPASDEGSDRLHVIQRRPHESAHMCADSRALL